jgi:DNA-binding response OmpR family regulator
MELPKHVLIVEDEKMAQRYLKNILVSLDIPSMSSTKDADETLKYLKSNDVEMILMDINLNGAIDGIQLAKEILKHYNVPIIFVTAYSDAETLTEAIELSPYGYIVKPFSAEDLKVAMLVAMKRFKFFSKDKVFREEVIQLTKDITYSLKNNVLTKENKIIRLSHKQALVVQILCENINSVVSPEILSQNLWVDEEVSTSTLRTLIYSIRKKVPELELVSHNRIGYSIRKV